MILLFESEDYCAYELKNDYDFYSHGDFIINSNFFAYRVFNCNMNLHAYFYGYDHDFIYGNLAAFASFFINELFAFVILFILNQVFIQFFFYDPIEFLSLAGFAED